MSSSIFAPIISHTLWNGKLLVHTTTKSGLNIMLRIRTFFSVSLKRSLASGYSINLLFSTTRHSYQIRNQHWSVRFYSLIHLVCGVWIFSFSSCTFCFNVYTSLYLYTYMVVFPRVNYSWFVCFCSYSLDRWAQNIFPRSFGFHFLRLAQS